MYDYDYEEVVLITLRILKYLHEYDVDTFDRVLKLFGTTSFDVDVFYQAAEYAIWEIYADPGSDYDEESGMESVEFSHPEFDRFYELGCRWSRLHGCYSGAWQAKIRDMVEYFVVTPGYSVFDRRVSFVGDSVQVKLWLSPDAYEPITFIGSLFDLLLYIQRENKWLEQAIEALEPAVREEAA